MIAIKKVKIDHYGRSTYGPEVWCRVYIEYRGKFYKLFQLIQTDRILTEEEATVIIAGRYQELSDHYARAPVPQPGKRSPRRPLKTDHPP